MYGLHARGVNLYNFPYGSERLEAAVSVNVMVICYWTSYYHCQMPNILLTHNTFHLNQINRLQNQLPVPNVPVVPVVYLPNRWDHN